ncbi:small Multidrug Resistance protein [Enterococcus sp. 8G7_MSG3316]|uniref:Small Multidrug Resistance protein n=1 Tax=Candidatus Enterococcus testudinis TaxID=1834191 RepID=A0A242A4F7_9ENTE|nr:multidrug efflux SMR transporter [Enterococcus sp. 8G7_MSG3316]OTN75493.1 small Multidrug Resistance protein [Enterococcus sp. 8G7_MSG3316]
MTWFYLVLGGLFEVVWASTMKLSNGFTHLWYSLATVIGMVFSFGFLALAVKQLPLSIAYPVWTGIGAVGSIIVGVILFKDQLSLLTWFFVVLLIVGILGIKFTSGH